MLIKGEPVVLIEQIEVGRDEFNAPIYTEERHTVENVLIAPINTAEQTDRTNLTGAIINYELGIPKGDNHEWNDSIVEFWGQKWLTVGTPIKGIERMIPLEWNKKVRVKRYE